jgi:hypothetical protein
MKPHSATRNPQQMHRQASFTNSLRLIKSPQQAAAKARPELISRPRHPKNLSRTHLFHTPGHTKHKTQPTTAQRPAKGLFQINRTASLLPAKHLAGGWAPSFFFMHNLNFFHPTLTLTPPPAPKHRLHSNSYCPLPPRTNLHVWISGSVRYLRYLVSRCAASIMAHMKATT